MRHGDYVRNRVTGDRGRIYYDYGNEGCPNSYEWLAGLPASVYGAQPTRFINSRWWGVLVHNNASRSDSFFAPEDLIEVIPAFDLRNRAAKSYFTDMQRPDPEFTRWRRDPEFDDIGTIYPTSDILPIDGCDCVICRNARRSGAQL